MLGYFLGSINKIDVLVIVEILPNSINDMNRDDIINPLYATYHGNNLKIIKIIDIYCNEYQCFRLCYSKKMYILDEVINHHVTFFISKERAINEDIPHSKYTGKIIKWFDNGEIKKVMNFKNGWKDGYYQENWANGKSKVICEFINGILHGKKKSWNKDGELIEISYFIDNKCTKTIKIDKNTDNIPIIYDNEFL